MQDASAPFDGNERRDGGFELVEGSRGGHLRRAKKVCCLGDADAIEVIVEHHKREALGLGR